LIQPELALKAISYSFVGLLLIALFFLLLIGVLRESDDGNALRGIVHLSLLLMGLFTFIALMSSYFQARKLVVPQTNAQRLDTATNSTAGFRKTQ
jgi:Na+/melibiose symporter-like transporter